MPARLSLSGNSQSEEGKREHVRLTAVLRDQRLCLLGLRSHPAGQPRRGGGMSRSVDSSQKLRSRVVVQAPGTPHTSPHHMLFVVGTGAGRTYSSGIQAFGHHIKPPNVLLIHLGFPVCRKGHPEWGGGLTISSLRHVWLRFGAFWIWFGFISGGYRFVFWSFPAPVFWGPPD